ncbi:MAG: TIGR03905 family TSCPD domain-containing protein [Ruminococcaceae bacterium]|nr:TIGR03905 family TSCPD domain-containing protein [Oscillospiraceae bacterium]
MQFTYIPKGVCSRSIDIEVEGDIIKKVSYTGGCNGNLKGIGELVVGMNIDDVIERLQSIKCGFKNTSCPAQLAQALKEYKQKG